MILSCSSLESCISSLLCWYFLTSCCLNNNISSLFLEIVSLQFFRIFVPELPVLVEVPVAIYSLNLQARVPSQISEILPFRATPNLLAQWTISSLDLSGSEGQPGPELANALPEVCLFFNFHDSLDYAIHLQQGVSQACFEL